MKITNIHIKDYHQFKDFDLDLTYPKGHPKEGKPLDKVCFIGQSGTGKTTILRTLTELIKSKRVVVNSKDINTNDYFIKINVNYDKFSLLIGKFAPNQNQLGDYFSTYNSRIRSRHEEYIKDWKTILLYFPSELQEIQDQTKIEIENSFF